MSVVGTNTESVNESKIVARRWKKNKLVFMNSLNILIFNKLTKLEFQQ